MSALIHTSLACLQFSLHTVMVVDPRGNGVPIAWVITSSSTAATLLPVLTALVNRIRAKKP